jgi:hypothetical protein
MGDMFSYQPKKTKVPYIVGGILAALAAIGLALHEAGVF